MRAVLVGPGAPVGGDVVLGVEGNVVGSEAGVLGAFAGCDCVFVEPADPIQEGCREIGDFVGVAAFGEEVFGG